MIEAVLIALIAAIALAYVISPLRGPARRDHPAESSRAAEAGARKQAAFGALVDLEEERRIGKLTQQDFEALRAEYEAEALAALKELDAVAGADPEGDDLEAEIAELRQSMECPECGALRSPGDPCPECGALQ